MSLFFTGERRPKVAPVELIPERESALEAVSKRLDPHVVSVMGQITVEQARKLAQDCRRVEPLLLSAIQDGTVTTQTSAVDFLRANTDGFFPAVKFVARMKANVGTEGSPATWAEVVTAAQTEALE
jgi:hypothetical protein